MTAGVPTGAPAIAAGAPIGVPTGISTGIPTGALAGGCQCGAVRFVSREPALELYICHCRECRKQSASAFGMSLEVPRSGLQLLDGEPRSWSRATDSGGRLDCAFCGRCGSRLWHQGAARPATVTIKAGALDLPLDTAHAVHIWTSRKLPGIVIPAGAEQFPQEPP